MTRLGVTLAVASVVAVSVSVWVSGCATVATSSPQLLTHQRACAKIESQLVAAGASIARLTPELKTDPKSAAAQATAISTTFAQVTDSLPDKEVKTAALAAAASFTTFAKDFNAVASGPTPENRATLKANLPALQAAFAGVDQICKA